MLTRRTVGCGGSLSLRRSFERDSPAASSASPPGEKGRGRAIRLWPSLLQRKRSEAVLAAAAVDAQPRDHLCFTLHAPNSPTSRRCPRSGARTCTAAPRRPQELTASSPSCPPARRGQLIAGSVVVVFIMAQIIFLKANAKHTRTRRTPLTPASHAQV
jgi:hypothetical protein